jgi:hypothetical protein
VSEPDEAYKAGADRYAQYFGDIRRHLASEFAIEIRWITASLFVLNAGGLVSLSGKDKLELSQKFAGVSFWFGILLAFSFVFYSQHKTKKFVSVIQYIENYWVIVAETGQQDEEKILRLEKMKNGISAKLSNYFSAGSFVMFSVGLCLLACTK